MTVFRHGRKKICVYRIGYLHRSLFAVERNCRRTVNANSVYCSRLNVAEMIGCGHEICKRLSSRLNAFGQSERNVGKPIVKAILYNDTERIERNRISDFERCFCCAANSRQIVYFDRISNVVRVALAVGCTAFYGNCITARNCSALLYGCNRERLSETIDSRNAEQFVSDGIGRFHVVFRCVARDCRCAVNFHVCDFDFHFVSCNIRC